MYQFKSPVTPCPTARDDVRRLFLLRAREDVNSIRFDLWDRVGFRLLKSADPYETMVGVQAIALLHYNRYAVDDPCPSIEDFYKHFLAEGQDMPRELKRLRWLRHVLEPRDPVFAKIPDDSADCRFDTDDPAQAAVLAFIRRRRERLADVVRRLAAQAAAVAVADAELEVALEAVLV